MMAKASNKVPYSPSRSPLRLRSQRSPLPTRSRKCSWGSPSNYQPRPALQYCRQQPPHDDESINPTGMNLILIKPAEHSTDGTVDLPPNEERTTHITTHLNKTTGDTVSLGFVDSRGGCKCKAVVLQRQNGGIRLVPKPSTMIWSQKLPEITLILAVPSPARLKYLWPVVASFSAVTRVVVVKANLSSPEFVVSKALQPSVYEPLIEKGMSQGGRTRPVKVDVCTEETISSELLERLGLICNNNTGRTAKLLLDCRDERATPLPARQIVIEQCGLESGRVPSAIIAVGPERGWLHKESKIFVNKCGFKPATLGSSMLRVDTTVMSGLAIVSAALDECQPE